MLIPPSLSHVDASNALDDRNAGPIRVAVVHPDPAVRRSSREILRRHGMQVFDFEDGASTLFHQESQCLDVILLGLELPDVSAESLVDLLGEEVGVVILATEGDGERGAAVLQQGGASLLTGPVSAGVLTLSVKRAALEARRRHGVRSRAIQARSAIGALTPRETEVFGLLVGGSTPTEIGKTLGIAPHTARIHRISIMQKLGASSVEDLIRLDAASMDRHPWPGRAPRRDRQQRFPQGPAAAGQPGTSRALRVG